jgi:hypothetical protein
MLVMLDNACGEEQLKPLLASIMNGAVIVTIRSRPGGIPGTSVIELDPLPEAAAVQMLSRVVGMERVNRELFAASQLVRLCCNLPLAIRAAGARLATRQWWHLSDLVERLTDERTRLNELSHGQIDIRDSLSMTYRNLSGPAQSLFRLMGWLNMPHVPAWIGVPLLELSRADAEETMADLADAQLVRVSSPYGMRSARYELVDLVRLYAAELAEAYWDVADLSSSLSRLFGYWLRLAEEAQRLQSGDAVGPLSGATRQVHVDADLIAGIVAAPRQWLASEQPSLLYAARRAGQEGMHQLQEALLAASLPLSAPN